ncbi:MAG TPA: polyphenol oxidase family protein [Gemmatimonadales bacterium]|nr:polyphenol oxidase family protein [Gemmatimonadales bacterium]
MDSLPAPAGPERPGALEESVAGDIPRLELAAWRDQGLVAGITGRGQGSGRGYDLGLWTAEPVGEVMGRWRALRAALPGAEAVALGNQVHGTEVMTIGPAKGWVQVEGIDGWVTTTPGTYLAVTVADCIPVYLAVPARGVALLHAGWRGTAGGILKVGVEQLLRASGADPADILMHCGVGICGKCYEVGSEVMTGCGLAHHGPGPWQVDLRAVLAEQARALGLERLTLSSWCSAHDRPRFYSHRASRGADGRMVAYLGMPRS